MELGYSLDQVQRGQFLVYAVVLVDAVWVVHVFKKKSTQGIGIPKHELRTILSRWRALRARPAGENQHEG